MTASNYAAPKGAPAMTVVDLQRLRSMRNAVIGSRTRKSELVAKGKVPELVSILADPSVSDEVRSLAATIIGSLAHAAPPPTLLSLCRAGASDALFLALENLSQRMSLREADVIADEVNDPSSALAQHLRLLETYLRSLRAVLMALADEVSPGTKWERGLGLGIKSSGATSATSSFSSAGKSAREVVGWQMAFAGFKSEGDAKLAVFPFKDTLRTASTADTSPHGELMLLARHAIAAAFQPERLGFWLGALFIAKLPVATKKLPLSRPGSGNNSRACTRPASPALNQHGTHSRSSSMSTGSDAAAHATPFSKVLVPSQPTSASQVRILAIVEMVAGILSSCLSIASQQHEISPLLSGATPEEMLAQRRSVILGFRADDSPYWTGIDEEDQEEGDRGRHSVARVAPDSEVQVMQGSFVKRGKSIDGRGMDEQGQFDAVQRHQQKQAQLSADQSSPLLSASASVLQVLLQAVECGYAKAQEAALWALTDLARENIETSRSLFSCPTPSGQIPTSMLLGMRKDPAVSVRLAAFSCLAHIIRVHPFTARTNECVLSVLVDLMGVPGEVQVAAIFAFARLVADSGDLQALACEQYESMEKLGALLAKSKSLTVSDSLSQIPMEIDDGAVFLVTDGLTERLREATLTALAALCFQRDELRRRLVDLTSPPLLPIIVASMSAPQVATRIAACRLIRALSRSISILRTSLVDAGVAPRLLAILQDEREDPVVRNEAICTICNLALKFSPMKQAILDEGGLAQLIEIVKGSRDGMHRLNALFAIKNILYASETDLKRRVMDALGWDYVREQALAAADEHIQEQAISIIRNMCQNAAEDIDLTLAGFEGGESFLTFVEEVIWQQSNEDILVQVAFIVVNMASGSDEHRRLIVNRPNLLDALVFFLNHARAELRVAGIWAAANLTQPLRIGSPPKPISSTAGDVTLDAIVRLRSFGFDKRLKELVEDSERDVSDRARGLITRFETV